MYSAKQVKELNEKLNLYIADQKEYLSLLQELPYYEAEFIDIQELHNVCDIANEHGRIGSPSILKFRDVKEIIRHFEGVLETLENDLENLISIAV